MDPKHINNNPRDMQVIELTDFKSEAIFSLRRSSIGPLPSCFYLD